VLDAPFAGSFFGLFGFGEHDREQQTTTTEQD
jgi:hypothetical protein